jgi:hypothetical protein
MTLKASSSMTTAILRDIYNAVGTGAASFVVAYGVTDDLKHSLLIATSAALGALGFRAGVCGAADCHSQADRTVDRC